MAPFWQGLYWSQGSGETLDVSVKTSEDVVGGRPSPLLVSSKSPARVVLGLMSPLLVSFL